MKVKKGWFVQQTSLVVQIVVDLVRVVRTCLESAAGTTRASTLLWGNGCLGESLKVAGGVIEALPDDVPRKGEKLQLARTEKKSIEMKLASVTVTASQ